MRRTWSSWGVWPCVLLIALAASACDQSSMPAPSNSGGIPVVERFTGTLQPSGTAAYAFRMSAAGVVQVTLISMTGAGVPADATFPIGIGTPAGSGCTSTVDVAAAPGGSPQLTTNKAQGVYCLRIFDNAKLTAAATFVVNISHPQ